MKVREPDSSSNVKLPFLKGWIVYRRYWAAFGSTDEGDWALVPAARFTVLAQEMVFVAFRDIPTLTWSYHLWFCSWIVKKPSASWSSKQRRFAAPASKRLLIWMYQNTRAPSWCCSFRAVKMTLNVVQMNPYLDELSLYDIAGTPGVATDVSHINTKSTAKVCFPDFHCKRQLFSR